MRAPAEDLDVMASWSIGEFKLCCFKLKTSNNKNADLDIVYSKRAGVTTRTLGCEASYSTRLRLDTNYLHSTL